MTVEERDRRLRLANDKRLRVAALRQQMRTGQVTLTQVLMDPPEELSGYTILDVLRFPRSTDRYQGSAGLTRLGRMALRDGVNLAIPLGEASARTRAWAAEHGMRQLARGHLARHWDTSGGVAA